MHVIRHVLPSSSVRCLNCRFTCCCCCHASGVDAAAIAAAGPAFAAHLLMQVPQTQSSAVRCTTAAHCPLSASTAPLSWPTSACTKPAGTVLPQAQCSRLQQLHAVPSSKHCTTVMADQCMPQACRHSAPTGAVQPVAAAACRPFLRALPHCSGRPVQATGRPASAVLPCASAGSLSPHIGHCSGTSAHPSRL
jgi:hypothetical protein